MLSPNRPPSKQSRHRQDRKPHRPGMPCELPAGVKTIERKRVAFLGESGPHATRKKPGMSGPWRTRLTGARLLSEDLARRRVCQGGELGSFRSASIPIWIAVNVTLRRFGKVRAGSPWVYHPPSHWAFHIAHLGSSVTWDLPPEMTAGPSSRWDTKGQVLIHLTV